MALFTPQGQQVKLPYRIGVTPKHAALNYKSPFSTAANATRSMRETGPGQYMYSGPGYSGPLLDYDPGGKEFMIGGRTYNARKRTPSVGLSGNADYLKNLPKAPVYDNTVGALNLPELPLPKPDEGRMEFLSQKAAAPGLRAARGQMQRLGAQKYSTPQEKAKIMREAFGGLGQAYEDIIFGSRQAGRAEYMELEHAPALQKAYRGYEADVKKQTLLHQEREDVKRKKFESAWNTWKTSIDLMSKSEEAGLARKYDWQKTQYVTEADRRNTTLNI